MSKQHRTTSAKWQQTSISTLKTVFLQKRTAENFTKPAFMKKAAIAKTLIINTNAKMRKICCHDLKTWTIGVPGWISTSALAGSITWPDYYQNIMDSFGEKSEKLTSYKAPFITYYWNWINCFLLEYILNIIYYCDSKTEYSAIHSNTIWCSSNICLYLFTLSANKPTLLATNMWLG